MLFLILQKFRVCRGSKLARRSLQGGARADSETEERPSRANGNGRAAGGLDELDNQLRVLSSSDNLLSAAKEERKGNLMKHLKIFIGNLTVTENSSISVQLSSFD